MTEEILPAAEPADSPALPVSAVPHPPMLPPIALDDRWAGRVVGGVPGIDPKEAELNLANRPFGSVAPLVDAAGHRLGFGLHDADNAVLRVWPAYADENSGVQDEGFWRRRLRRAFAWRQRLGLVEDDTSYRLINGEGDGLAGLLVDVYAGHVLIQAYSPALAAFAPALAEALPEQLKAASVTVKVRPAGATPVGRIGFQSLADVEAPAQLIVREDEARYEVHLLGGLNTGLFSDMREVRRAVRGVAQGQRVLNLFSYSGAFSVAAAQAGAKSVTSVDFAGGVIEWSKVNFALNDLDPNDRRFKFVKEDAFDWLKEAKRKGAAYDLIVLDPPTATNAPGRRWFLKTDYHRLIAHALRTLAPGGLLVAAANSVASRPDGIEQQLREGARDAGRRLRLVDSFGLPADFPTQLIHPQGRYLKAFFLLAD